MKKKALILYIIGLTIVFAIFAWFSSSTINPLLTEGIMFLIFYAIFLGAGILFIEGSNSISSLFNGNGFHVDKKPLKIAGIIILAPIAYLLIMQLLSSPLFNAKSYRDQLGEPEVKEFSSDIETVDINNLPVVDLELASKLAEKKLGEKPSLGSQVHIGEPTIQNVNGKLVWVVPLEHSGFFKWISNLEGTPGYIVVSATDPKDVTYVDNYLIKYQPSSFFAQNLERHVRFGKGFLDGLTDYSFELNDQGEPFWVVTTYQNSRLLALPGATGVIIVNAQTGEQQKYAISDVPNWVDRIQPRKFISTQIANRGEYINGIFNFSNKDKFKTSSGSAVIYNHGDCYMITGLTSVGSDNSTIGFMMVNLRTKQVTMYHIGGATEYAAQQSAEGKVQNLGYKASFPITINVNGIPTYFMTLKDKEGLIKQYAFVSIKDYNTVGNGETLEDAKLKYEKAIAGNSDVQENTNSPLETIEKATVSRIAAEATSQGTTYKVLLQEETYKGKIFLFPSSLSEKLALTQVGDTITLTYFTNSSNTISCESFDNLSF
ncbi:MAG: hypothetical protein ACLU8F_00330 [Clostridia bacterium]